MVSLMHGTDQLFPLPGQKKKLVDVNLQQRNFVGFHFVIWAGGSWLKNNGANFFISLQAMKPVGKVLFFYSS